MNWNESYPKEIQPELADIERCIGSPLWRELCLHLADTYNILPKIEHSVCSGAPGWNVKYKKAGRALCTLYPNDGFFTALVCIGGREQMQAEALLPDCCDYVQALYKNTKPFNGSRWLMVDITDERILEDTKALISTRVKKK